MLIEDSVFLWLLLLSIVVGIVLTIYFIRRWSKSSAVTQKSCLGMIGISPVMFSMISFVSYATLKIIVTLFLSWTTTTIHEIEDTGGKFRITSKCYFCKSRLPEGSNPEVLKTKGVYYYNSTNHDIACFNIFYYYRDPSMEVVEMARKSFGVNEKRPSFGERVDKNTVIGDVITPHSYYVSEQTVEYAFEPSPPIIKVSRSKTKKHDSEKVTIMDVQDSILKHHGVKFVAR